jgi:hypothetical protein
MLDSQSKTRTDKGSDFMIEVIILNACRKMHFWGVALAQLHQL